MGPKGIFGSPIGNTTAQVGGNVGNQSGASLALRVDSHLEHGGLKVHRDRRRLASHDVDFNRSRRIVECAVESDRHFALARGR